MLTFLEIPLPIIPAALSATQAEKILRDPAGAWFEIYLETEPLPNHWKSRDQLGLAEGNRLHGWIAQSFRALFSETQEFYPLPDLISWEKSLAQLLDKEAKQHQQREGSPDWWKNHFENLRWKTELLLKNLHAALSQMPDAHVACEYSPRRPLIQALPEFPQEQEWQGRIDWIALNDSQWDRSKKILVIDLKTGGSSEPFQKSALVDEALYFQLLVYAGLVEAQHPGHPEISLHVTLPRWSPVADPVTLSAFDAEFKPLWQRLSKIWHQGIYGQTHAIHQRFATSQELPLCTTPIPQEVLDSKNKSTHFPH